ncbi:hypothetical protein WA026_018569 [Henosepilachna vigintioctopunctata]|uniref:Protein phosphatase 1 regulatory subunit 42 n=1 Tax=Henosepilachna vigintioctopunctata TaxID=420089 RepID=A0AAW1UBM8_9CUCU
MKSQKTAKEKPKLAHSKFKISKSQNQVTHYYLDHKNLTKIPDLDLSTACVIYLHNNSITIIENLKSLQLSSLYLQCNNIQKIENLEEVPHIKKLYLGNNEFSVLEGISHLNDLEELHIEKQRLPIGMSLCFDPRSVFSIAKSLQVLDVSDNGLESLSSLAPLRHLKFFNASNNKLNDIDEVCEVIKSWFYLRDACFSGNPMSRRHRYREDIVAAAYCLENLDDKPISATTRNFIKRFENEKLKKTSRPSVNLADIHSSLPRNYPPPLQKAVSASLIQKKMHVLGPLDFPTEDTTSQSVYRSKSVLKKRSKPKNQVKTLIPDIPGSLSLKITTSK